MGISLGSHWDDEIKFKKKEQTKTVYFLKVGEWFIWKILFRKIHFLGLSFFLNIISPSVATKTNTN